MGIWKGSKEVFIQSSTSPIFVYHLQQDLKTDITLTAPVAIDATIINVSAGHGFTAATGETLTLWENSRFVQAFVVSVATDAITISLPVDHTFTIGAKVVRGSVLANLNGSVTPVFLKYVAYNSVVPIDINKVIIQSQHPAEADDGKFAGITALTNGIYLRKVDGDSFNIGFFQNNLQFKCKGWAVDYTGKAPAGSYSSAFILNILDAYGQVLRINPRSQDELKFGIRDNLTGLTLLRCSIIGSYTEGE